MYRYKFQAFIIFCLFLFIIQVVDAKVKKPSLPLFGKVITVDAGHGGIG